MTTPLRCAACGYTGFDVQPRIVEVDPARNVTVYTGDAPVPERFRVESRCIDHEACADRAVAYAEGAR